MQTKLLHSQAFICGLLLLLVNDFILKYSFPGWFTGKLSDFAGLFIFPLFWIAFFPKYRQQIIWATVLGFLWWKTPLADSFINCWNQIVFYSIHRVIDYTDYLALVSVLFAWKYSESDLRTFKVFPSFVAVLSLFSFCATSAMRPTLYQFPNPQYLIYDCKIDSLITNVEQISTYSFVADSNGVFREEKYEKRYSSYDQKTYEKILIGDSLLLVKVFGSSYFEEYEHLRSYSGKVRFMEKVKKERQRLNADYLRTLNYEDGIRIEEPHFTLMNDEQRPPEIEVKKHPAAYAQIDTFSIQTKTFGQLEQLHFKHSLLHGKYIRYWKSSSIKVKGNYEEGLEEGMWEYFDSTGVKIKEAYYKEGELQKEILIENGTRKNGPNAITKRRVLWAQFGMLFLCFVIFGTSIYWYKKWFKPRPPTNLKTNLFLRLVGNFIVSVTLAFAVMFFSLWVFAGQSSAHVPFGWDLPIGLDGVLFFIFSVPLFPFIYFLVTRRFHDFFWVLLWTTLGAIVVATISFLLSLL